MSSQPIAVPDRRRRGFTPIPNWNLPDWSRLLAGAEFPIVMYITSQSDGAVRPRGTEAPYWTPPISTEELADVARCTIRAVQGALDDLVSRKVIERKKGVGGAGFYRYHVPWPTWESLPDRPRQGPIPISGDPEEPEEEPADEPQPTGVVVPVFEKPQRLKGGARPRAKELPAPAGKLRVTADSEIEYTGTICDGVLSLEFKVPRGEQEAGVKRKSFRSTDDNSNNSLERVVDDAKFRAFEQACRRAKLSWSSSDLGAMYKVWCGLSPGDRDAAIQGIVDRAAAGEFSDPRYCPLPQNYLQKRIWERAVRKSAGATKGDIEAQRAFARFAYGRGKS